MATHEQTPRRARTRIEGLIEYFASSPDRRRQGGVGGGRGKSSLASKRGVRGALPAGMLQWVVAGVGIIVVGFAAGAGGYMFMTRPKPAAVAPAPTPSPIATTPPAASAPALLTRDAAFAQAKLDASLNPDVQILVENYDAGMLQTQDKKTGQVTTSRFDPNKRQMVADQVGSAGSVAVPPAAPSAPAGAAPLTKDAAFAGAKLDAELNPGLEVVRQDYASGTLQTRDKKTGQVTTLRFDSSKGQMVPDAAPPASAVSRSAAPTPVPVRRSSTLASTLDSGLGAAPALTKSSPLPAWIPSYPHSTPLTAPSIAANPDGGRSYSSVFTTTDPPHAIVEYYRSKLEASGFAVTMTNTNSIAEFVELTGGDHRIQVVGTINTSTGQTVGTYTAIEK